MWRKLFIVFVLILALSICQSQADDKKDDNTPKHAVIWELNEKEFNKTIQETDFLVVCYYSKKSRGSREFMPIYKDISDEVFKENKHIVFTQIDITKYPGVEKHGYVLEIPMLRFFKKGRYYDFRGQKTVKHVTTWIHLAMNVPLVMSSHQELEDLKKRSTVIVGCFVGNAPADGYKTFLNVSARFVSAKYLPLPRFALITKASVSRDVGMTKGTVAIYKGFERGEKVTYEGSLTDPVKLLKFCEDEGQPIVFPYGANNYTYRTSHSDIQHQHLLFMDPSESKFKQTFANFKEAAKSFMKSLNDIQVLFLHVDTSKTDIEKVISFFHVDIKKDVPCNRITAKDKYHSRFIPRKMDFTKEGFIEFTKDVLDGKIKRNIRSEKLPGDWNQYPVKVLVGSNYESVTHEKGKLVFVMYYIPDDKECEKMKPVIDEVALKYRRNNTVVIATMDVSKNDGEVDVHHTFPSYKLFTADNKNIMYYGSPTAASMQTFIDSNGVTQLGRIVPAHEDSSDLYEFESSDFDEDPNAISYEDEEEREHTWTMEELKMIENAVEETKGHEAHNDEKHLVNAEQHHHNLHGVVSDHHEMDPKEHAHIGAPHPHDTGDHNFVYHDHHRIHSSGDHHVVDEALKKNVTERLKREHGEM